MILLNSLRIFSNHYLVKVLWTSIAGCVNLYYSPTSLTSYMSAAGPGQCSGWSEWEVMAYYLLNVHTLARRIHQQPRWLPLNVATFTHFIIHTTLPSVNVLHITSIITATEALLKEKEWKWKKCWKLQVRNRLV